MSIRYQTRIPKGVINTETGAVILPDKSSQAWRDYLAWLEAGNVPLPPS